MFVADYAYLIGLDAPKKVSWLCQCSALYVVVETQLKMLEYRSFKNNFPLLCDRYRIKVKEVIVAATNEEVINGRGSFFNYVDKTW